MLARCAAIALLACGSTMAQAQRCPLPGPATPQPAWVSGGGAQSDDALYGTGVTEVQRGTALDVARDAARASALTELAQQVQTDISTRITTSLEKVTTNGKSRTSESFSSVGEVQSRLVLRATQIAEQWSDLSKCRLWVRVRMPRAEAELARRAATSDAAVAALRERLRRVADNNLPLGEREAALAEAQELASLADPALTSGFSRDGFELQRTELTALLAVQRQRETAYRNDMNQHVQAMALATGTTEAAAKRQAQQQARTALERALTAVPQGVAGFSLPFVPTERLATLYADLGMVCSGRQWFERRNLAAPPQLGSAACDGKALAREQRLQYLAGKTVQLDCSVRVSGGEQAAWPKACSEMLAKLAGDGAAAAPRGTTAQLRIELRAEGEIEERRDAESGRPSWRFRGRIRSLVQGPEIPEIVDNYETQTGWQSTGAAFQTDLLAVLVATRLDATLTANWGK
jgi:hypothetical protein